MAEQTNEMILKRGIFINAIGIVSKFSKAGYLLLFSRLLGASNLGIYLYCYGLFDVICTFAQLGAGQKMAVDFGKYRLEGKEKYIFRNGNRIFAYSFAISTLVAILVYFATPPIFTLFKLTEGYIEAFQVLCWGIPFFVLKYETLLAIRATFDTRPEAFVLNLVEPVLTFVLGLVFLHYRPDIQSLCFTLVVTYALIALIGYYLFARKYRLPVNEKDPTFRFKNFLKSSTPIMAMETINSFMGRADMILIGLFVEPAIVGIYGAALELGSMISKIRTASDPTLPSLVQKIHYEKDMDMVEKWFTNTMFWTFFVTLLINGIIALDYSFCMSFFKFDPAYHKYFILAPMIAFGRLVHAVFGLLDAPFYMLGYSKTSMSISAFNFVLNVIFFSLLIPKFGIYGAGIGFIFSALLTSVYRLHLAKRLLHIQPIRFTFIIPIICALVAHLMMKPWLNKYELPYYTYDILMFVGYAGVYYLSFLFLKKSEILK